MAVRQRQNSANTVPDFFPGPAVGDKEYLSEAGANELARTIKFNWAALGWDVETRVERVFDGRGGNGTVAFAVRSDLINGLPQRRLAEAPRAAKQKAA